MDLYGSFQCSCKIGYTGLHCQYQNSCNFSSCPSDHTCILSVIENGGYFCYSNIWNDISSLVQATLTCGSNTTAMDCIDRIFGGNIMGALDDLVGLIRSSFNLVS